MAGRGFGGAGRPSHYSATVGTRSALRTHSREVETDSLIQIYEQSKAPKDCHSSEVSKADLLVVFERLGSTAH
jgi:hypothetical protein